MKFTVQILETQTYRIEVEADDADEAIEQAHELYANEYSNLYEHGSSDAQTELVINEETGEERHCL